MVLECVEPKLRPPEIRPIHPSSRDFSGRCSLWDHSAKHLFTPSSYTRASQKDLSPYIWIWPFTRHPLNLIGSQTYHCNGMYWKYCTLMRLKNQNNVNHWYRNQVSFSYSRNRCVGMNAWTNRNFILCVLYKVWSQLKRAIFHHFPDGALPPSHQLILIPALRLHYNLILRRQFRMFSKDYMKMVFLNISTIEWCWFQNLLYCRTPLPSPISTNFQSQHVQLLQGLEEVFWKPKDINLKVNSIMATGECFPGIPVCEKENSLIELSLKTAFALRYLLTDKEYQGCQKI